IQAEARSVLISFRMNGDDPILDEDAVRAVALAVNELVTNALKHAFETKATGRIWVEYQMDKAGALTVTVDDDGVPMNNPSEGRSHMGLTFISRLISAAGGEMTLPPTASKCFTIKLPQPARRKQERQARPR
ncbi:MAG: sensor histidine kinase, partial [Pacificimonas sp.]